MDTSDRKLRLFVRWALAACLGLVLLAPGQVRAQSGFSGIVVFGTSLSDSGNAFALLGDAATPPDFMLDPFLIPSEPYAKGGHHFSNGATWVEQFARTVGLADSVRPALATADPAVTNFAVGAARAYEDGLNYNLGRQVDTFLQRTGGVASSQALYAIEIGSNDVRDAFLIFASQGDGGPTMTKGLAAIAANIQKLYAAGARQFLVWTVPNISLTPAIRSLPGSAQALAIFVTQGFNTGLAGVVAQLSAGLPGSHFARLDAYKTITDVVANPAAFDMTVVSAACVTPNVPPFTCKNPDGYLFWDGIHPTKAGHAIIAQAAADALK